MYCDIIHTADSAHVPFAHHGTGQGDRNKVSSKGSVKILEHDMTSGKMAAEVRWTEKDDVAYTIQFSPPCRISYETVNKVVGGFTLITMGAPSGRGQARFSSVAVMHKPAPFIKYMSIFKPRWKAHTNSHKIQDGDTPLLRIQERVLQLSQIDGFGGAWKEMYTLANGSWDAPVLAYRKWVDRHGPNMPWRYPPTAPVVGETMPREAIIERYHQHTKDCKSCRTAMRNMEIVRFIAFGVAALAAVCLTSSILCRFLIAAAGLAVPPKLLLTSATTSAIVIFGMLALAIRLTEEIKLFGYTEVAYDLAHSD